MNHASVNPAVLHKVHADGLRTSSIHKRFPARGTNQPDGNERKHIPANEFVGPEKPLSAAMRSLIDLYAEIDRGEHGK